MKTYELKRMASLTHYWDVRLGKETDVWRSRCKHTFKVPRRGRPYKATYTDEYFCLICLDDLSPTGGVVLY